MKNITAIIWSCIICHQCFLWSEIDVGNPRDYTDSGNTVDLSSASIDQRKEREYSGLNAKSLSVNGWIQIQNKDIHHTL